MDKIRFSCKCGSKLAVPPGRAGKKARCPNCGAMVTIPSGAATAEQPSDDYAALYDRRMAEQGEAPPVVYEPEAEPEPEPAGPAQEPTPEAEPAAEAEHDAGDAAEREETPESDAPERPTKNCPFCGEKILAVARKCKHCGEFLDPRGSGGEAGKRGAEDTLGAGPILLMWLGIVIPFLGPLLVAIVSSALYYAWRDNFPKKARQANRHGWAAFLLGELMWFALMDGCMVPPSLLVRGDAPPSLDRAARIPEVRQPTPTDFGEAFKGDYWVIEDDGVVMLAKPEPPANEADLGRNLVTMLSSESKVEILDTKTSIFKGVWKYVGLCNAADQIIVRGWIVADTVKKARRVGKGAFSPY